MNTDRIEPSVDHEFTLSIASVIDSETSAPLLEFVFRTVREFSTFGYSIAVEDVTTAGPGSYTFELGGLRLPVHAHQKHGGAETIIHRSMPRDGTYPVTIRRRARTVTAQLVVAGGKPHAISVDAGGEAFVRVEVVQP